MTSSNNFYKRLLNEPLPKFASTISSFKEKGKASHISDDIKALTKFDYVPMMGDDGKVQKLQATLTYAPPTPTPAPDYYSTWGKYSCWKNRDDNIVFIKSKTDPLIKDIQKLLATKASSETFTLPSHFPQDHVVSREKLTKMLKDAETLADDARYHKLNMECAELLIDGWFTARSFKADTTDRIAKIDNHSENWNRDKKFYSNAKIVDIALLEGDVDTIELLKKQGAEMPKAGLEKYLSYIESVDQNDAHRKAAESMLLGADSAGKITAQLKAHVANANYDAMKALLGSPVMCKDGINMNSIKKAAIDAHDYIMEATIEDHYNPESCAMPEYSVVVDV